MDNNYFHQYGDPHYLSDYSLILVINVFLLHFHVNRTLILRFHICTDLCIKITFVLIHLNTVHLFEKSKIDLKRKCPAEQEGTFILCSVPVN